MSDAEDDVAKRESGAEQGCPRVSRRPVPFPEVRPKAREVLRHIHAVVTQHGRFPKRSDLLLDVDAEDEELQELAELGAIRGVSPHSYPDGTWDQATVVMTRNGARLLGHDVAAVELSHARAVYDALFQRYREVRRDHWWSFDALVEATGLSPVQVAIGFVLLLADVSHPGHRQLDPLLGYPSEFPVDLALVKAKPKWELDVYELLTRPQYYRAEQAFAAAEGSMDVSEGSVEPDPLGAPAKKPEPPELPPNRSGDGKGGRLSTEKLAELHREETLRRWRAGDFKRVKDARLYLHKLINREGDHVYEKGDAGYKEYSDLVGRTKNWFLPEERGMDAPKTPSDKG